MRIVYICQALVFSNNLKIISDTDNFLKWLKNNKIKANDDDLFIGYKFFITTAIESIIGSLIYDNVLQLEESELFSCYSFQNLPLNEYPHDCEKAILLKNLGNMHIKILQTKNWDELRKELQILSVIFKIFDNIQNKLSTSNEKFSKKELLSGLSKIYTYHFLGNKESLKPYCYHYYRTIQTMLGRSYFNRAYFGYVLSFQYIWFNLLGDKQYRKSCFKNMDKIHIKYVKKAEELIESEMGVPVSDEELKKEYVNENYIKDDKERERELNEILAYLKKEGLLNEDGTPRLPFGGIGIPKPIPEHKLREMEQEKNEMMESINWFSLQLFLRREAYKEQIDHLYDIYGNSIASQPPLVLKKINKRLFEPILTKNGVKDPWYLIKDDKKSQIRKLDNLLLFNSIVALDGQQIIGFIGWSTFITTVMGTISLRRLKGESKKVSIIKFIHPIEGSDEHLYSYGVFIDEPSELGYDGWLIFYDFTSDEDDINHAKTEWFFKRFNGDIHIIPYTVDAEFFLEYLKEKSSHPLSDRIIIPTPYGKMDMPSIFDLIKNKNDFISDTNGKFFEYIYYKWLNENKKDLYDMVKSDINDTIDDNEVEIDCMGINEKNSCIDVFECKHSYNTINLDKEIDKLHKKIILLKKLDKYKKFNITPHIVFYQEVRDIKLPEVKKGVYIHHFKEENKVSKNKIKGSVLVILDRGLDNMK